MWRNTQPPNMNLRDLASQATTDEAITRPVRRRRSITSAATSFFQKAFDGSQFEDEIKAHDAKYKAKAVSKAGRVCNQGVARQIVVNDEQWTKFRDSVRATGAVTGISLKHNLDSLLHARAKEIPKDQLRDSHQIGRTVGSVASIDHSGAPGRRRHSLGESGGPGIGRMRHTFSALATERLDDADYNARRGSSHV